MKPSTSEKGCETRNSGTRYIILLARFTGYWEFYVEQVVYPKIQYSSTPRTRVSALPVWLMTLVQK